MKYLCTIALFVAWASVASSSQAQLVEDTRIFTGNLPFSDEFSLGVFQNPFLDDPLDFDDPTSVFGNIEVSGSIATLFFTLSNIDEGSDWFIAAPGDSFSAESISAGDFENVFSAPVDVTTNESFFFGVNTGQGFGANFRAHFGWAELTVNTNGGLTVLDSAVAYNVDGIVIGENQVLSVPEPSAVSVGFVVVGAVIARRRRKLRLM